MRRAAPFLVALVLAFAGYGFGLVVGVSEASQALTRHVAANGYCAPMPSYTDLVLQQWAWPYSWGPQ